MEPFNLERVKAGEPFFNTVSDPHCEIPVTYLATLPDGKIVGYYNSSIGYIAGTFREEKMQMKEDEALKRYKDTENKLISIGAIRDEFYIPITRDEFKEKWNPDAPSHMFTTLTPKFDSSWVTIRVFGRNYNFLIID